MAKNILGPESHLTALELKRRLAVGFVPFFRMFLTEGGLQTSGGTAAPAVRLATTGLELTRTSITMLNALYGGHVIPSKSAVNRINKFLTDIDDIKIALMKDDLGQVIIQNKADRLPMPIEELNYRVSLTEEYKERGKAKGLLSQILGMKPSVALGLGTVAQFAAPALGPFFGTAMGAIGLAKFLARPTIWTGRMLGRGIGALAGASLANRGGWRTGGGFNREGRSRSAYGTTATGLEAFMGGRGFEPQAPMAGLGAPAPVAPTPQPAMDLSSAGRMLAMARWGKKDTSTGGTPSSYELSKNMEYFFDKRAYKARWTRDVAAYLKTMSGGIKTEAGGGVLAGALGGLGKLIKDPLEALGLLGLAKGIKNLLPILGRFGLYVGLAAGAAWGAYQIWKLGKAGVELHKARSDMIQQYGQNVTAWQQHIGEVKKMGLETYAKKQGITTDEAMGRLISWKQSLERVRDKKEMGFMAYVPGLMQLLPWLKDTTRTKADIEDSIKKELGIKPHLDMRQFEEKIPSGIPDYDKLINGILKQNEEAKKQTDKLDGIKEAIEKQNAKPTSVPPRLPSAGHYDSADPLLNLLNYHGAWPIS